MGQFEGSISPAIDAFWRALEAGADRDVALEVALAKLRAMYPAQAEWTLRTWLAKGLVEARLITPAKGMIAPPGAGPKPPVRRT
jgi:hypothetical protein